MICKLKMSLNGEFAGCISRCLLGRSLFPRFLPCFTPSRSDSYMMESPLKTPIMERGESNPGRIKKTSENFLDFSPGSFFTSDGCVFFSGAKYSIVLSIPYPVSGHFFLLDVFQMGP